MSSTDPWGEPSPAATPGDLRPTPRTDGEQSFGHPAEPPAGVRAEPALDPVPDAQPLPAAEPANATARRRPRAAIITLSAVLAVVVIAVGVGAVWVVGQLDEARARISDQQQQLDQQRELIEQKQQFGAAMQGVYDTVQPLVGLPYSTLVPWTQYDLLAARAWNHRWKPDGLREDAASARQLAADLTVRVDAAAAQAASNTSGTAWEATIDRLGSGWVTTVIDAGDTACGANAIACVLSADPYTVHVAARAQTDPTMTEWIRTGVAYHEYAHVLQLTNPEATDPAVAAFGGDYEAMADCYALTFLDGWTLDHQVPIDASSYWEVSVGYGYTCVESQRQVIRDWVGGLGLVVQPAGA